MVFLIALSIILQDKNFIIFLFLLTFRACIFHFSFFKYICLNVNNRDFSQFQLLFVLNVMESLFQFIRVIHVNIYTLLLLILTLPNEVRIPGNYRVLNILPINILEIDIMLLNQVDRAGNHRWTLLDAILIIIVSEDAVLVVGHYVVHCLLGLEGTMLSLWILLVVLNLDSGCLRYVIVSFNYTRFIVLFGTNCLV